MLFVCLGGRKYKFSYVDGAITSVRRGPGFAPAGPFAPAKVFTPPPAGPSPRQNILTPPPAGPPPRQNILTPPPAGPSPRPTVLTPPPAGRCPGRPGHFFWVWKLFNAIFSLIFSLVKLVLHSYVQGNFSFFFRAVRFLHGQRALSRIFDW